MPHRHVPIVSLSHFENGGREVAEAVDRACTEVGFFQLADHGVDAQVLARIRAISASFFDLPHEYKLGYKAAAGSRGYTPMGTESISATASLRTPSDLKEAFAVAAVDITGAPALHRSTTLRPIAWPGNPEDFRTSWHAYYFEMRSLAMRVLRLLAGALRMPLDFFEDKTDASVDFLRVINYPPPVSTPEPGQLRAGEHTDFGVLTLLATDDAPGGLQIRHRDGVWLDIPHRPGCYIVNIGDLMSYWTNGVWRSAVHRVANPDSAVAARSRRQSVVFFHNPNHDALIEPIASFRSADDAAFEPVVAGEWIRQKGAMQRVAKDVS